MYVDKKSNQLTCNSDHGVGWSVNGSYVETKKNET